MFKSLIKKLHCLFSAMACAEAGDLDGAKDILQRKDESAEKPDSAPKGRLADAS